jgi:hypothetical protein
MVAYKKPTVRDAEILIKLLRMGNSPDMRPAMTWFDKEFKAKSYAEFKRKYPDGSPGSGYFGEIMTQLELAGVLVSHGLLNENLFFDMSGIGFMWERVGPIVAGMRKEMSPVLYENAVWLAERQKKWSKTVWKPNLAWKR